jgi:hypothetical protein
MSSIYPVPLRARPHAACTPKKRPANLPAVPFQFYSDLVPPSTVRSATAVKTATAVRTTTATEAAATLAMETPTAIPSEAGAAARAAVKSPAAANAAIRIVASTHCGAPVECAAPNKSAATVQPAIKATVVISASIKPAPKSVEPRTGSDEDSVDEIIRPPESIRSARVWRVIVITVVADRRCAVSVTISATDSNSYRYLGV